MMEVKLKYFIFISLVVLTASCAKEVKEPPVPEKKSAVDLNLLKELSPEEEKKVRLSINFDGTWKKKSAGSKAVIIIEGKKGKIIGKNGGEIPVLVKYLDDKTVKILEYEYNPKYLSNWLPEEIARQVYLNEILTKTYSILRIIDDDTLTGVSHAWQVYYNGITVQNIEELVMDEEWKRVKE